MHRFVAEAHGALGFGGNRITYSPLAAQYLAAGVERGEYPDEARLFAPGRARVELT